MAVVIDTAGAFHGGAARFVVELDRWLGGADTPNVRIIGRGRRLTPSWLLTRERFGWKEERRIALNNASFSSPFGQNIVLLRNALHFCSAKEMGELGFRPSRDLRAQIPVIRALVRHADRVVVPCCAMATRVATHVPSVENRIVVRPHPVSAMPSSASVRADDFILVPVVPAPYKCLDLRVEELLAVSADLGLRVVVTASSEAMPRISSHPEVDLIGLQDASSLARYWHDARAIYYPTGLEAFGYPLAEARVAGRWVIARDTRQNREIAGQALAPFDHGSLVSLRDAVVAAMDGDPVPENEAFDPERYFHWLTQGAP